MVLSTQILRLSDQLPLAQSVDDDQADRDLGQVKQQVKVLLKKLTPQSESRCSIESGKYTLHYLISAQASSAGVGLGGGSATDPYGAYASTSASASSSSASSSSSQTPCLFLTISPKSYPRKLAFSFLDDVAREFHSSYGSQVHQRSLRPYAFVGFDTFLQKTKRVYADSRTAEATSTGASTAATAPVTTASATSSNLDRLTNDLQDVTRIMTKNMEDLLWRGDSLDAMSTMSSSLRDQSMKYRKAAKKINFDAMIRKWAPVGAVGFLFLFVIWIKFF